MNDSLMNGKISSGAAKRGIRELENSWMGSFGQFAGRSVLLHSALIPSDRTELVALDQYSEYQLYPVKGRIGAELSVVDGRFSKMYLSREPEMIYRGPLIAANLQVMNPDASEPVDIFMPVSDGETTSWYSHPSFVEKLTV